MNKILLSLTILSAGAGGFVTARQSTIHFQHEAKATREAWLTQTQFIAAAQSEQAGLTERIRELKETLAQSKPAAESALWSALQTNRADLLPPELRERLLGELGFHWRSSLDFIVVSKATMRDISIRSIQRGKLTDLAATVLAITPEEHGQIDAALQSVQTEFANWVLAHVERREPKDEVLAHYYLSGDPAVVLSINNNFATGASLALGKERAEMLLPSALQWMSDIGLHGKPAKIIVQRDMARVQQPLTVQMLYPAGNTIEGDLAQHLRNFPAALRPIFPNRWADVARREGFELPEEPRKK